MGTSHQDCQAENPRIARRKVLKCAAWAGTGLLWTVTGGVPQARNLIDVAQAADKSVLSFLQISDSHIGFTEMPNPNTVRTLEQAISRIKALPITPAFMIHTGDISHHAKASEFDDADRIISMSRLDVHYVPGERDLIDDGARLYRERYGRGTKGRGWYSFDANGVHFIGLVNATETSTGTLGYLGAQQLDWLARDLGARSPSTPIIVFAHVPLWPIYPAWGWATEDGARALDLLKSFGSVTILNGHVHQTMQKVEGNIIFHSAPSTAFPRPAPGAATAPGPLQVSEDGLRALLGASSISYRSDDERPAIVDTTLDDQ